MTDDWLSRLVHDLDEALTHRLDLDAGLADARLPARADDLDATIAPALDLDAGLRALRPEPGRGAAIARLTDWVARLRVRDRVEIRKGVPLALFLHLGGRACGLLTKARLLAHLDIHVRRIDRMVRDLGTAPDPEAAGELTRYLRASLDLAAATPHYFPHSLLSGLPVVSRKAIIEPLRASGEAAVSSVLSILREVCTMGADIKGDTALRIAQHSRGAHERLSVEIEDYELPLRRAEQWFRLGSKDPAVHEFGSLLTRALAEIADDLRRGHRRDDELRTVLDILYTVREDFTGLDLREEDLDGVDLVGVTWSAATTRWPDEWAGPVRLASVAADPADPDLFVVRDGPRRHADALPTL